MAAETGSGGLSTHRIEALTDGIYAVAMTLLVIDLKLPEHTSFHSVTELVEALLELLPRFLAWAMSFFVLAFFWIGHHRVFSHVRRCDGRLVWLNILQLAFVSLMPFACDLLGEHGRTALSQAIYSGDMFMLALFALLIARYVHRRPELSSGTSPPGMYEAARVRIVGLMIISVVAVLIAGFNLFPAAGSIAFALMMVINPWSRRVERRIAAAAAAAATSAAG